MKNIILIFLLNFCFAQNCSKYIFFGAQKFEQIESKWVALDFRKNEFQNLSTLEIRETQLLPKNQSRWEYFQDSKMKADEKKLYINVSDKKFSRFFGWIVTDFYGPLTSKYVR